MIRLPLRNQIRDQLREELVEGAFHPGEQIVLQDLADRLSVSPTPAREALGQLEEEGLVRLEPNRGFFVAPMSERDASEIYPLLADLEALALELQEPLSAEQLDRLRTLNRSMESGMADPARLFETDRAWHEELVGGCPNTLVLRHLTTVRNRAERYERAYMVRSGKVSFSTEDHRRIVEALQSDAGETRPLLRAHWDRSSRFVRRWLRGNDDADTTP